ncbi:unnamed protein product [Symbiodinium natans]|uniref:Uncharacterized protein n=1 Tax=Symbiodinium natans TaxID=878477 RepID=A0A812KPE2_9DINO|nr:unnamed protein product [Symbiodinium natans]
MPWIRLRREGRCASGQSSPGHVLDSVAGVRSLQGYARSHAGGRSVRTSRGTSRLCRSSRSAGGSSRTSSGQQLNTLTREMCWRRTYTWRCFCDCGSGALSQWSILPGEKEILGVRPGVGSFMMLYLAPASLKVPQGLPRPLHEGRPPLLRSLPRKAAQFKVGLSYILLCVGRVMVNDNAQRQYLPVAT